MGMRKPEQKLWDQLRNVMVGRWRANRIESRLEQGVPDVYFGISRDLHGWIELKVLPEYPKKPTTLIEIPHYTSWQANWHWTHRDFGTQSWIVVKVEKEGTLHFFPSRVALALLERVNTEEFKKLGVVVEMKNVEYLKVVDALLRAR